ncbi:MAG: hypothetical protein V4671_16555, partial [Armatimonadota bacterium]
MTPQILPVVTNALTNIAVILGKSPMPMNSDTAATAGLIALLAVIVINGLLLGVWGIRRLYLERGTFQRNWSYLDLWLIPQVIAHLFGFLLVPLMFLAMPNAKTAEDMMSSVGFILPMLFIQNIVFFGVPTAFIRWKYQL